MPMPAGYERDSFGFQVSPSIQFSFPMEQTTINFGYIYSLKYYENKPIGRPATTIIPRSSISDSLTPLASVIASTSGTPT